MSDYKYAALQANINVYFWATNFVDIYGRSLYDIIHLEFTATTRYIEEEIIYPISSQLFLQRKDP